MTNHPTIQPRREINESTPNRYPSRIGFALPTFAQEKDTVSPEIHQQIEAVNNKYDEAYNMNDAAAIVGRYTQEVVEVWGWSGGSVASGQEATKWGAYDYLLKPFEMQDLLAMIADGIAQSLSLSDPVAKITKIGNRVLIKTCKAPIQKAGSQFPMQLVTRPSFNVLERDIAQQPIRSNPLAANFVRARRAAR